MNKYLFFILALALTLGIYGRSSRNDEVQSLGHNEVSKVQNEQEAQRDEVRLQSSGLERVAPPVQPKEEQNLSIPQVRDALERGHQISLDQLDFLQNDLDQKDGHQMTLLHYALDYGQFELALELLKRGASPHISTPQGLSPLALSVIGGSPELVATLLPYGLNSNEEVDLIGTSILMVAALEGQEQIVALLLEHGANPNHQNGDGKTALMLAADMGEAATTSLLIQAGADPRVADQNGQTAYDFARSRGLDELAQGLEWQ